ERNRGVVERLNQREARLLEAVALARLEENVVAAVLFGDPDDALVGADGAASAVVHLEGLSADEPYCGGSKFDVHITPSPSGRAADRGSTRACGSTGPTRCPSPRRAPCEPAHTGPRAAPGGL